MPWLSQATAVVAQLMPGQMAGAALARVLFGKVNPSAKLPVTFPTSMNSTWLTTPEQYPGVEEKGKWKVSYSEQLLVGYRW
jgi:beta-glucosidase